MRHTVTEQEFDQYLSERKWNRFACSGGPNSDKSLELDFCGNYRVTDHGIVTYDGTSRSAAIRAYNAAN